MNYAKAYKDSIEVFRELNGRESSDGSYTREIDRLTRELNSLDIASSDD